MLKMTAYGAMKKPAPPHEHPTGYGLLHNPRLNKGTAFTEGERRAWGLEGLLPPAVTTMALQVARRHAEIASLENDLQKYLVLSDLQARNETLYYAVLMSDPATYMPLVYTPTVGEACQKFAHIFRAPRGIYLPISARGRLKELLSNWPEQDVRFIVVTDGERILGLGDLGAGGMGIPIGKLSLYTACAGVPPPYCLPVVLDVGTNNQVLLDDPLYQGLRQQRVRGEDYLAFVDDFVAAADQLYAKCCIQWEDFANFNAVPILARYRDKICTFNDDIQGTAGVALAGIIGVSTVPKLFSREVIEAMARINKRPIIFPYSNPTSRSECTAEEAYKWSEGRAVFASGSPFPPVEIDGRRFIPGQGNNVYIFPAMGMAVFATEATRVTEEMFIVAAQAVAEQVTEENLAMGLIYPPQSRILEASLHVAERIAACIFEKGLARVPRPDDVGALIRARAYRPVYAQ